MAVEGRIPLVYVVSNGRSGSTLLDLLLGANPECWSVGELQILPWELKENRAPCGCGTPIEECDFWSPLIEDRSFEDGPAPLHHFRDAHGFGKVLRREHLLALFSGKPARRDSKRAVEYADRTADLLARVLPRAEARRGRSVRWMIDASKDPYRLFWLASSERFDLRVVHLTKDPRAFVHSMTRRLEEQRLGPVLRYSARWVVENALMRAVTERALAPEQVRRIRYEDLAGDPETTLGELGEWLGVEDLPASVRTFREVENHAVSGNEMRWRAGNVRLDERWRREMPAVARRLTDLTTLPVRSGFGYSR